MKLLDFFFSSESSGLKPLSYADYAKDLIEIDPKVAGAAFEKSWQTRNFEIELYWKRATYFWAFIASTFAGYFALINTTGYRTPDRYDHAEVYFINCVGLVVSVAWFLTNKGSKAWQRHWEVHVDLLEDRFTGPLYKTVNPTMTYSVSKLNEIVSIAICSVWVFLGIKYFVDQQLVNLLFSNINWFVFASTVGTILLLLAMFCGYGRGRFSEHSVSMSRRSFVYRDPGTSGK
jgi:hypothetical protein